MRDEEIGVVLDRLARIPDGETGDWSDVLERARPPLRPWPARSRGRARRALVLAAPLTAVAVAALAVTAPWRGGPTILARAAAAVPDPTSSQVLYEDVVVHAGGAAARQRSPIHLQAWLAGTGPHRFRVLVGGSSLPTRRVEVGGVVGGVEGLSYSSAFRVLDPLPFALRISEAELNPAAFIRAAVASGLARTDGTAVIAGRRTIRIRVTSRLFTRAVGTTLYFVDARTYEPVRVIVRAQVPNGSALGFPMADLVAMPFGAYPDPARPYVLVFDFKAFRYLPATGASRRATDIRAQHPDAEIA